MKKILIILLSITLGHSSFASTDGRLYKCISPTEIQVYYQLSELLVLHYTQPRAELYRLKVDCVAQTTYLKNGIDELIFAKGEENAGDSDIVHLGDSDIVHLGDSDIVHLINFIGEENAGDSDLIDFIKTVAQGEGDE